MPTDPQEMVEEPPRMVVTRGVFATTIVVHRAGVPWYQAPLPRRLHRCTPWTECLEGPRVGIARCACGAIRDPEAGGDWVCRNSRRRDFW